MDTTIQAIDNDDTPGEIDFKRAVVGKFYHPNIEMRLPVDSEAVEKGRKAPETNDA